MQDLTEIIKEIDQTKVKHVNNIAALQGLDLTSIEAVFVGSYREGVDVGGGLLIKSEGIHNGVTFFDTSRPFPDPWTDETAKAAYFLNTGVVVTGLKLLTNAEGNSVDNAGGEIKESLKQINTTYLDAENYTVSGLVLDTGHKIKGQGQSVSKITTEEGAAVFEFNGQSDTEIVDIEIAGLGKGSLTAESGLVFNGANSARRNRLKNVRLNGFSDAGIRYSGGWGNKLNNAYITSNKIGIDFVQSSQLAGWSGSGFVMDSSYISSCDTGIQDDAMWNFTSINSVIEDCTLPIKQLGSGTASVWINTWFESNAQSPELRKSNIFIGGRLEGGESPISDFYGNMTLPATPFDYQCITEIVDGVRVFRDSNDEVFAADGQGVKAFRPHLSLGWDVLNVASSTAKKLLVARGSNGIGGGITSETWGNDSGVWVDTTKLVARRHFNSYDVDLMPEYGVKVQGQTGAVNGGTGYIRVVFSTGNYQNGGAGTTEGGDRWEFDEIGHLAPLNDAAFDIGPSASTRVRDMRIANAPIVGSDYRIKADVSSIPRELLDFALSIEIKQYRLRGRSRTHYGIVITPDFLNALSAVTAVDDCAAFCHDIFTDIDGNPIKSVINGVELGDLWQVRYDEWQNILLEAMRQKIITV